MRDATMSALTNVNRRCRIQTNPSPHPQKDYAQLLSSVVSPGFRWLEIGCGRQIVPEWALPLEKQKRLVQDVELVGIDVDPAIYEHPLLHHRLIGLADSLPTPPESFDLVTANMVMEHVTEPDRVLNSVFHALKPGGTMIVHTPNYQYYLIFIASLTPDFLKKRIVRFLERREEADVFPTVYRFNTAGTIRAVAEKCGFQVEQISVVGLAPSFRRVPLLSSVEAKVLALLAKPALARFQSNLLVVLRKPETATHAARPMAAAATA